MSDDDPNGWIARLRTHGTDPDDPDGFTFKAWHIAVLILVLIAAIGVPYYVATQYGDVGSRQASLQKQQPVLATDTASYLKRLGYNTANPPTVKLGPQLLGSQASPTSTTLVLGAATPIPQLQPTAMYYSGNVTIHKVAYRLLILANKVTVQPGETRPHLIVNNQRLVSPIQNRVSCHASVWHLFSGHRIIHCVPVKVPPDTFDPSQLILLLEQHTTGVVVAKLPS
jgi:hypothetical protein